MILPTDDLARVATRPDGASGPALATFAITAQHAHRGSSATVQPADHLELLETVEYHPSLLVLLDESPPADVLDARVETTEEVRLFRVRSAD